MKLPMTLHTRRGQGTAEYVLILALVVGLLAVLWKTVGPRIETKIESTGTAIDQSGPGR